MNEKQSMRFNQLLQVYVASSIRLDRANWSEFEELADKSAKARQHLLDYVASITDGVKK